MSDARTTRGFTLVELLVVLVILGLLAGIVVPRAQGVSREAFQSRFADSLHTLVTAAQLHKIKTGNDVPDGSSGLLPVGFGNYVRASEYEAPTPIGGAWDTEVGQWGVTSAIGVHFNGVTPKDDGFMAEVDAILDDGILATGAFRKLASDRFYYVLVP